MKESVWRSKLIQMRRKTNPADFIWSMDAKFKAGFPDIYLLTAGRPFHIELKIGHFYELENGLAKIQELTLTNLFCAGADAFCFNLQEDTNCIGVTTIRKYDRYSKLYNYTSFYNNWKDKFPFSSERI